MVNRALEVNPPNADININYKASNFLWAIFAAMLFTDILMMAWCFTLPKGRRTFHYLSIIILTTASIAYFSMASDLGATPVYVEFYDVGYTRQIWYVRYIDWVITTPCLLLELVLATGLPLSDIIALIFFDEVMIITGLVGGLVVSSYKWGYFAFGCAALVYIWFILLWPAMRSVTLLGPDFKRAYVTSAVILSVVWTGYPIAWGLADGGNYITPTAEMVFYGVLDFVAKPVFTLFHVYMLSKVDYTKMQLQSGKFSEGASLISHPAQHAELDSMRKNARADSTAVGVAEPRHSTATAVGREV